MPRYARQKLAFALLTLFVLSLATLVGPSGLEPPTSCLSGTRSNLLSYEPMWLVSDFSHLSFGGDDGIRFAARTARLGRRRL